MKLYDASAGAYLLLVSFSTLNALDFSARVEDTSLSTSPFDGIAIPYVNPYHHKDVPHEEIHTALDHIQSESTIDVWPWVFVNRLVGYNENAKGKKKKKKAPFKHISGMDLRDASGDLSEFYNILDGALKYAKKEGTGIVIDLEPYNNHAVYDTQHLADTMGVSVSYVIESLEAIGSHIISLANGYDENMKIWLLYTSLNQKKLYKSRMTRAERSVSYIVRGMLKEIKRLRSNVMIIAGGEISIGYCNINVEHLNKKILRRDIIYHDLLIENHTLTLGAPLVPWLIKAKNKGWLARGNCKKSKLDTGEKFRPLIESLSKKYDYIWVYSTGHSDYKPFSNNNNIIGRDLLRYK